MKSTHAQGQDRTYEPSDAERLLSCQKNALEMLVQGYPLEQNLQQIARTAEREFTDEFIVSILLVSDDGRRLLHGAAPSISNDFNKVVDGIAIGPYVGSCGAAVYHGHEIVVDSIATDRLWQDYAGLALSHGLQACWSTPIRSSKGIIIGTFALYYRKARQPSANERQMVNILVQTAGIVIEWHQQQRAKQQTDAALKESEQRFQNLIRDASVGIIVLEGDQYEVSLVNNAYARLVGRTTQELQGQPLFTIIPDARKPFEAIIDTVRKTAEPLYLYEQPYQVQAAGHLITGYLNLIYQPYRQPNGAVTGVMVLCQDVTAQMLARQRMQEAEETARMAVAAAELGTYQANLLTDELIASDRLYQIFDVPVGSDRDRIVQSIHPDDLSIRTQAYNNGFVTGSLEYEVRIVKQNGAIRWIRTRGKIFYNEERQPQKLLGLIEDITDEKEFAAELTRLVKERTKELEQVLFVSHHDLQEPLRKISIFSQTVLQDEDTKLSSTSAMGMQKITAAAARMSTALRDVLNLANTAKTETFVPVNINEVIEMVLSDLELAIADKHVVIQVQPIPVITASAHQMQQLFYNLINNAIKFSKEDVTPQINIRADRRVEEGTAFHHITVQDNGIGFEQDYAEKIFALYQRLHTREQYAGTGIGLALCQRVVSNHHGKIWAESAPRKGATFHILLPE